MPTRLSASVNISHSISKRSMALDGTIYFVSIDDKGRKRLFATQFKNLEDQPLSFSDG
jgi:hypothetical protein